MIVEVIQGEAVKTMRELVARGVRVDACITDPPYGTTACAWDSVTPFAPMWAGLKRLVKSDGATVLFGSQPFTSALVMSNPQAFKYEFSWDKVGVTGFLDAKKKPLKRHENILVFADAPTTFNPQMGTGEPYAFERNGQSGVYGKHERVASSSDGTRYPTSILRVSNANFKETGKVHPTQKPVELMRYLIRTYTNEGDTVLDFTCGSGSTGVACVIEGRNFIGIEQDAGYCEIARARILRAQGVAVDIPCPVRSDKVPPLFATA